MTVTHQVALSFEDGVTRFITCAEGQTVADASYRSRINIPLDCRDGACGTCKAFCESGDFQAGTYIEDALSQDEADRGYCLPCSMSPRSDLVLQIASTSAVAKTTAATHQATVTDLERLSPTTTRITLTTPTRADLAFLPGQYVNIAVPGTDVTRSYSFSNAPDQEELTFLVKHTPGGVMTTYLEERAAVGDALSVTGPNGSFFLRDTDRPALLLAGGTGLAPILSILRRLQVEASTRPVHLVYGVSTDDDLVELETLEALADQLPGFTWNYCVADPQTSARNTGYVTGLLRPEHLHEGEVAVYLCGPPPMVEAVRQHFSSHGLEPTGFYYEKFALSTPAPAGSNPVETQPEPAPSAPVTPAPPGPPRAPAPAAAPAAAEAAMPEPPTEVVPQGSPPTAPTAAPPAAPVMAASWPGDENPAETARTVVGQHLTEPRTTGPITPLDPDTGRLLEVPEARAVAGQAMFAARETAPLVARAPEREPSPEPAHAPATAPEDLVRGGPGAEPDSALGAGGYVIGEEHPSVQESDAIFEARQALELGALSLTIGRLTTSQLAGYRLLAESTLPHVDGDRFVDAAAYTDTNAAFHDYLFTLTRNEHLLQAYQALGVQGHMQEVLRNATWCHPRCATDHVEVVDAFEAGDLDRARTLIIEHADRSKMTMRRAMDDARQRLGSRWVSPGRFSGKVVLVTGAAQGIGERTARRICAEGGRLVLVDRSELVHELSREFASAGYTAHAVTADLETWAGANAMVQEAIRRFGRIDVAIHTVGGTIWARPFHHYLPEEIQAEINRSLFPTLWSCRAILPHFIERRRGTIVNVSSVATRGLNRLPYAAAKGGVNAITASLALEAAEHGIRVVATAPGGTDAPERRIPRGPSAETEQERAWYQTIVDQTVDSSLMKRYGDLDEQAAAISFLASDEASYITGTVLPVAGGDLG